MSGRLLSPRALVTVLLLLLLLALPLIAQAANDRYILSVGTRIVIWAIAAVSLNMILGYGGLVSFGHAAFIGIGGYAVGILSANEISSGWIQWPVALLAATLWAALVAALSLRTRGVYFIMITLAFAQLVYYLGSGLEAYGGDDGLNISRSRFASTCATRRRSTGSASPCSAPPCGSAAASPIRRSATCCAAPSPTRAAWPRSASRCSAIAWSPA
jgi:branched-chain amino acid transport system permease protein